VQLVDLWSAGSFVYLALMFYVLGSLVRDELWLRVLILTGSFCYVIYYIYAPERPLWDVRRSGRFGTRLLPVW